MLPELQVTKTEADRMDGRTAFEKRSEFMFDWPPI